LRKVNRARGTFEVVGGRKRPKEGGTQAVMLHVPGFRSDRAREQRRESDGNVNFTPAGWTELGRRL